LFEGINIMLQVATKLLADSKNRGQLQLEDDKSQDEEEDNA